MQTSEHTTRQNILALLDELPNNSLSLVETFIRFVLQQSKTASQLTSNEEVLYQYPTVPVPAESLDSLIGIMPDVEGDALADTEALYDEV